MRIRGFFLHSIHLVLTWALLAGCSKIQVSLPEETTSSTSSSTTSYTCYDYFDGEKFNSLLSCQIATGAQCTSSLESFPNSTVTNCYTPMATDCLLNPPSWEYTAYTVSSITTGGYILRKSLLGCSREECICSGDPVPNLSTTITYGSYVPFVSGLPSPCTIYSCGPYVYQGSLGIENLNFSLSVSPVLAGPSLMSTDTAVDITLTAGPASQTLYLYSTPNCSGIPLNGVGGTLLSSGGNGSATSLPVTGGGMKTFYAILSDATVAGTTQCSSTGLSFYQIITPTLNQPVVSIIPNSSVSPGQQLSLSFTNQDSTNMVYDCTVDTTINGSRDGTTNCLTLPISTFSTTTALFTWTPSASTNGSYEICVQGTNDAGSNIKCSVLYFVNSPTYSLNLSSSSTATINGISQTVSSDPNPSVSVSSSQPGLTMHVYTDSSCSSELGSSSVLTGLTPNATVSGAITSSGSIHFYAKYEVTANSVTVYSRCLDTGKSYYRLQNLDLNDPTDKIFPSEYVKTLTPISLSFQANDPALVTYTCKYNQNLNNSVSVSGSLCSTLSGASFSNGVFTWTPPLTAYGPYQVCVDAVQGITSDTDSECAVINVIPNTLVLSNLAHYYDAQFASSAGGNQLSSVNDWFDLIGSSDGQLKNTANTTFSGWSGTGSTTNPYAVTLNTGTATQPAGSTYYKYVTGLHEDAVDLGTSSNSGQSMTVDFWIKPTQRPTTTSTWVFNCLNGVFTNIFGKYCWYQIGGSGGWGYYPDCTYAPSEGLICDPSQGCGCAGISGHTGWNNYPTYDNAGFIYSYHDASSSYERAGMSSYILDNGLGTAYSIVFDIRGPTGTWSTWCQSNTLNYGQWVHVTEVWNHNASTRSIYVNGVNSGCSSVSVNTGSMPVVSRTLILGAKVIPSNTSYFNRFNGSIANFRMYNNANTAVSNTNFNAEKQRFGY